MVETTGGGVWGWGRGGGGLVTELMNWDAESPPNPHISS